MPLRLRKRNPKTHKGNYGHVFIIGASPGLTGAVCLTAHAAQRSGCGLVTAGVPKSLNQIFEIKLTEEMSLPLEETKNKTLALSAFKKIKEFSRKADILVLGPGAGRSRETQQLILKILGEIDKPMVVDADGINAIAGNLRILKKRKAKSDFIITPHLGEFSRLIKEDKEEIVKKRKKLVKEFSLRYNLVLVLKGHHSLVAAGNKIFENTTANAGMATAGSGDVLSGIIASFLAQGLKPFEAARWGVYTHGLAGDLAAKDKTQNCLAASDIIQYLPKAFSKLKAK